MNVSPSQSGNIKIDENIQSAYPYSSIYANGTTVNLEAIPADGYDFAVWSGSVTSKDNPITLDMTCPKSVTALFAKKGKPNLIISIVGDGSVTPSVGIYTYDQVTVVNLTATPNAHYMFKDWTGDVADNKSASTTVTVDSTKNITANFSPVMHSLSIEIKGAGSVDPFGYTPKIYRYSEGSIVNITAIPDPGYEFYDWTGEVDDVLAAKTKLTMDSDKTIVANFSGPNGSTTSDTATTPGTETTTTSTSLSATVYTYPYTTPPPSGSNKSSGVLLGIYVTVPVVLIVSGSIWMIRRRKKRT